jgi:predicted nucleic acid-binding protein
MFILDTNVISELRNGKPNQSPEVRRWAAEQSTSGLFLSVITILELEKGILALERRVPDPRSERDSMIAATAIEHGFTVVTGNTQDFVNTGVTLLNPWSETAP